MKVKVCGITTVEGLQALQQFQIDYAGLIFYPSSSRYMEPALKDAAAEIKSMGILKTGVFVNAPVEKVKACIEEYGLTAVQLHGDETPGFCKALQPLAQVVKVFRIAGEEKIDELVEPYANACDYYLFDTDTAHYGGSGKQFNWALLEKAIIGKPFFLSGGIGPEDMEKVKSFQHPYFYAVDVNSRFEVSPGIKDMGKIKSFVTGLKGNAVI